MAYEDVASNYASLQDHAKRIKELERKIGNTNIGATLDSDASRISDLEDGIKKLAARLDMLEVEQVE